MAESVKALPNKILNDIELKIWNVCTMEGFNRKKALNVVRIPSLTINNQLAFEAIIPDDEELLDVMHKSLRDLTEEKS